MSEIQTSQSEKHRGVIFLLLEVVAYPYEGKVKEGQIAISAKGDLYVYCDNEWVLIEEVGKWEEVYDANGENIGRVKGNCFEDYRLWVNMSDVDEIVNILK